MIPFVILTTIRSGSTHLTRMLNDHPNVVCNGEVFNPDDPDYNWGPEPPKTTEEMIKAAFVDFPLNGHDIHHVEAVGCKLEDVTCFYEQGRLVRLMQEPRMRFIVLQRRNQFECLRSFLQAMKTQHWQMPVGQDLVPPPVTISPMTARTFFERAEAFFGRVSLLIPPGQRIWVDYEQLVAEPDYVMSHLWKFLEVEPWKPIPHLAKIEERPLSETIENYGELRMLFQGTDYSIFLP